MNSHPPGLDDLQERLSKLEQQNRRFKQLGAPGLVGVTLLFVMGQAPAKKTVEANEFILRDGSGNVRAKLSMVPTSPTSTTMTIPGIDHPVPMTVNPTPTLALYGDKGETKAMLDTSNITFENSEGKLGGLLGDGMLTLANKKDSFAMLTPYNLNLQDQDGFLATLGSTNLATPRTGVAQKTSAASLVLFDKNKNVIWKAP